MATSRQIILEYLQRRSPATTAELSHAMGVTAANIRHHLSILVKEGAVAVYSIRAASGRGRPARLYTLARQANSHNLDGLAAALLDSWLTNQAETARQSSLRDLAHRLNDSVIPPESIPTLTRRLNQAVTHLNEMNYKARWEARRPSPHVIFGHCPYVAILEQHPELCQLDAHLLEDMLATPVAQIEKLKQDQTGRTFCRFALQSL